MEVSGWRLEDLHVAPAPALYRSRSPLGAELIVQLGPGNDGVNTAADVFHFGFSSGIKFAADVPFSSFKKLLDGSLAFTGMVNGLPTAIVVRPLGGGKYAIVFAFSNATLTGLTNTAVIEVAFGDEVGATTAVLIK